jgi:precorrin-6A/cobalt-precorrin-6A reductase
MKIIVMAGTSDAVNIMSIISTLKDIEIIATTTTKYGGDLALASGADEVLVGALGSEELADLIKQNHIDLIVDATHPFASEATLNAIKSANKTNIHYIRFERPSIKLKPYSKLVCASDFDEAADIAINLIKNIDDGKIMHLAGVSTLPKMIKKVPGHSIIVRVLPGVYSITKCLELGIPSKNIIAMQGTFSEDFNESMMKEYDVNLVVTKESGNTGGTPSKIEAARKLDIPVVVVKRPKISELENKMIFSDIEGIVNHIKTFKIK